MRKYKCLISIVSFGLTIWITNSKQHFEKKANKVNIFISYKTICLTNLWNYSDIYSDRYTNTRILFVVPKKPNTEYRKLFGIEIIRIPNMNTTIWSYYSNSIQIPNYLSHPEADWSRFSFFFIGKPCFYLISCIIWKPIE